jgi:hypothetical protein
VRVHTDTEADPMSKEVNASAFTAGQGIYFQSGKFGPNSQTGPELLADEVIRTVQQSKEQVSSGSITGGAGPRRRVQLATDREPTCGAR